MGDGQARSIGFARARAAFPIEFRYWLASAFVGALSMTVIFGLTFITGGLVAADTRRHNSLSRTAAGSGCKVRSFGNRAVVAKAGYGPSADHVWDRIAERVGERELDAADVADIVEVEGGAVLKECRARGLQEGAAPGDLQFLISGITGGEPTIHGIQLSDMQREDAVGPGKVIAFGMRGDTQARAVDVLERGLEKTENGVLASVWNWTKALIEEERQATPYAIEFPADVLFVRADQNAERLIVDPTGMPNPRGIVRVI